MSTLLDAPAIGRRPRAAQPSLETPARASAPAVPLPDDAPRASHRALEVLERALHVLLTPLDSADLAAWRCEVHAALLDVFQADGLSLYFPIRLDGDAADTSALDDWYAPHLDAAEAMALLQQPTLDPAADAERAFQARGVAAASSAASSAARGTRRDDFDVLVRPPLLPDATFVRVPFGGAADARLWILGGPQSADERIALVRTIMPALRAGLATWVQLGARRAALGRLLDAGAAAVLAFDTRGALLHESVAGARLLADESAVDAARVRDAARQLALVAAHARAASVETMAAPVVRTARHRYELAATRSPTLFGREPVLVVSLRRQAPAALDDAALRERFALTKREIEVARLLAEGLSNVEMAERMGVSFFTARNHVERLLRKLGVSNRARVGALLRDDGE